MTQPSANMTGVRTKIAASGSRPVARQSAQVMNAARIRNAPWAMLMMFITPKMSVRPEASSAYTPPINRPRISAWRNSVTGCPWRLSTRPDLPLSAALGAPLRDDLVARGRLLGQDDLGHAALPLTDQELALRAAHVVPGERTQDGVDLVVPEPVGELALPVALDRPDRLHGC